MVKEASPMSGNLRRYLRGVVRYARSNGTLVLNLGVVAFVLAVSSYLRAEPYVVLLSATSATILVNLRTLPRRFEEGTRKLMVDSLLLTGRGLRSGEIRLLGLALRVSLATALALSVATVVYTLLAGFNTLLLVLTAVSLCVPPVVLVLPRVLVRSWASERRVRAEVELPYLVILLRTLSVLRIPIYDIVSIVESSAALPNSAREVRFSRKVSTLTGTSLLSSLDAVYAHHPSDKVSNLLRRVVEAAVARGDYGDVAEKVFEALYSWFESRVSGLVGNLTIIVGTSLFVYLFVPVVVAAVAPVIGGSLLPVLGASLAVQVSAFFTLYALIASLYPSSLIVRPSRRLRLMSLTSLLASTSVVLYNVFSLVAGGEPLGEYLTVAILVATNLPTLVVSEAELRRVRLYDTFVRAASDALSVAAATGENPVAVLERSTPRYGRGVARLTRAVTTSYVSERLRRATVARAPSTYHAAFVETLMNVLRLGATPEMLKILTSSYERLITQVSRVRGFARTLEALLAGLVAVVGGFLTYIDRVFNAIANLVRSATGGTVVTPALPFTYEPRIYSLLGNLSILSLILISVFVGCVRGGSYNYSSRSFLLMLALYVVFKNA
ncbi:MAG: hypothetical protein LM571_06600, partial [Desulfurococcaceae archaeon]|nr:hypothetical protein [Desulfurococcaceae archaeon]